METGFRARNRLYWRHLYEVRPSSATPALPPSVCLAARSGGLARETEFFPDFPEPVPASAQDWSPADPSSFDAARQALLTAVRGEDASERSVLSLLSRMTDRFNELLTEYYFCSLDYMRSPTSCTQEYVRYSSVCGQAESDYLSAVQEVLNSAYGSVLAGAAGGGAGSVPPVHLPQYAGGAGPAGA